MEIEIKNATESNVIELMKNKINFNLKVKDGFIYMVGGILCKVIGEQPYSYDRQLKIWREL